MKKLPFTAFSVDHTVDLTEARNVLQKPTQGNLDNTRLLGGETAIAEGVERVLSAVGEDHIFNLGHGVLPSTPPEAVSFLVNYLRSKS
jgi:uroporphyrinogen decarboxylase